MELNTISFKDCSKCEKQKSISEFYKWKNGPGGYYPSCKECKEKIKEKHRFKNPEKYKIWRRNNYVKNRESIIKKTSEYQKNHPEMRKKIMLKHQYGMSEETYKTMEFSQNGKCAICFNVPINHVLFVDHCHKTKKVRGLLCRKCNAVLGMCNDDEKILQSSIDYLRRY